VRDLTEKPYSPDEKRVAKFFADLGVGGGDDPIGFLLASHAYLASERNIYRDALKKIKAAPDDAVIAVMRSIAGAALDWV
jgi:hypothetical protein